MRNTFLFPIGILVLVLLASPVYAEETIETIENVDYFYQTVSYSPGTGQTATNGYLLFKNIDSFENINLIQLRGSKSEFTAYGYGSGSFSTAVGSGHWSVFSVSGSEFDLHMQFDSFNRGAMVDDEVLPITWNPAPSLSPVNQRFSSPQYSDYGVIVGGNAMHKGLPFKSLNVYYTSTDKAVVHTNTEEDFTSSWVQRVVDGYAYNSNVTYIRGDGVTLATSVGTANTTPIYMVDQYTTLYISFASGYSWSKIYYPTGDYAPGPTPTPTPTPTPVPELCGYWSLAVNTSNIKMNEYVLGTLTEEDPSDRYDMIDWYRVLETGQEYEAIHYVYDPGLFGLGAGWFEVTQAGNAYPVTLDQVLENAISFPITGKNHLRAKIYDDVSLLPMVYHDYDLVCTLDQVVYVGRTTQATNTLEISTCEADTYAILTGVNIGVYDYGTGEWQNKTPVGSSAQFNTIPGHNIRVLAQKTGWLPSDTNLTVKDPPGIYPVYLKRPLIDVVNESYVFFYVKDSQTITGLFQANIQLSDGQVQSTLPSGYAGFSVNDGETYYYTVTKPGYQSYTNIFTITEDTTIPVYLTQIAPTPTLTYPTTFPTVTITGTGTPTLTPTGTGTIAPTGSATPFQTLSPEQRTEKTTKAIDFWIDKAETIGCVLFLALIMGAFGLIMDSMGGGRRRKR